MNAIEAMGSVDDRARILRVAAQVVYPKGLVISIEDSGCGIEPKNIELIFDRFFTTKSHCIGMGLWICRSNCRGSWRSPLGRARDPTRFGFSASIADSDGSRHIRQRRGVTAGDWPYTNPQ
jgi:hypothetical protein